MGLFKRAKRRRACVVGLDGVPHSLLTRLMADGTMPATARIVAQGTLQSMTVSLPEISAVSWPSFMTGANSGTHGIFGFVDLKPNSYALTFPSYAHLQAPTLWDRLADQGKRSIVINQPSTYPAPARPIKGVLISGFVAIDMAKAVYPASHRRRLEELGYRIDVDTKRARVDPSFLMEDLRTTLDARERAVDYLWEAEEWDYFEVVVTGTDRLHHFLWSALEDPAHSHHDSVLEYYRQVDAFVGRMADRFARINGQNGPLPGFFFLSDHGFTEIRQEVYLNRWLQQEGYLAFPSEAPESLEEMAEGSRAFALDPSRIYLNVRGKYPKGCMAPEEVPSLREELAEKLQALECDRFKVVRRVFSREEVYSGPLVEQGPDLVVLSRRGFDLKGSLRQQEMFGRSGLEGMHTWDDAFFFSTEPAREGLSITDCAEIILRAVA